MGISHMYIISKNRQLLYVAKTYTQEIDIMKGVLYIYIQRNKFKYLCSVEGNNHSEH